MLNSKFRRLSVLTACTFGLGLGVLTWTASPLRAEDAPAAAATPADKDMDRTAMKESMTKVKAMMADSGEMKQREMHKDMMRMQMIHQMMMSDPDCKKMMEDMKKDPKAMKMSDEDMMKMKKEIANESAKNEEMMHTMMIHMMAKDSMMKDGDHMKHEDMKDKDGAAK